MSPGPRSDPADAALAAGGPRRGADAAPAAVVPLRGDDAALVAGLQARQAWAMAAFYDRFAGQVERLLRRLLGGDDELDDVHHEVFVQALRAVGAVRDPGALAGWVTAVTVFTARTHIRQRARRRWLWFLPDAELEAAAAPAAPAGSDDHGAAVRATYAVLARLPVDERLVFTLRFVEQLELTAVAAAVGVSLATVKRRLGRAEARFVALARRQPELVEWLEGGARWTSATR